MTSAAGHAVHGAPPWRSFSDAYSAQSGSQVLSLTNDASASRCSSDACSSKCSNERCRRSFFDAATLIEIDLAWNFGDLFNRIGRQQTVLHEPLRRDQQRIAGIRREASVRRVAVARRVQWQHLPDAQTGLLCPIEKCEQLVAEVADAVAAGERRWMQEDAGGAG